MSSISVLLVEDNPLTQSIAKDLLLSQNCSVDVAKTGLEALEKFKQRTYQIIFLDIQLPDVTGYEIIRRIRVYEIERHQAPVWVIGLTASVKKEEFYQGIDAGMNEIYSKPLSAKLLHDILQNRMSQSAAVEPVSRDSSHAQPDSNQVIDLNLGAEILGSNVEAAKKMVSQLVDMLPGDLKKIQAAFSKKDYAALKDLAHYVKGGASFCGTPRLKEAASHLDQMIKTHGNDQDVEAAYHQLCREITAVIDEYHRSLRLG